MECRGECSYDPKKDKCREEIDCRIDSVSTQRTLFFRIFLYLMLYKRIAFTCCRCCVLDYFFLMCNKKKGHVTPMKVLCDS